MGVLTITEGDEDWILFDVCEGGRIDVDITFSDIDGDLMLVFTVLMEDSQQWFNKFR